MTPKHIDVFVICIFLFSAAAVKFIPGKGCGSLTPIKRINTMPTEPEEIEKLECVIVEDEDSYQEYHGNLPRKS